MLNFVDVSGVEVRLVGGKHPWEGRVEVKYNDQWGTVCDDNFQQNEANVICGMMGYKYVLLPGSQSKHTSNNDTNYIIIN